VEDILIASEKFHLLAQKALKLNNLEIEVLLADVSKHAIERLKKAKTTLPR